MMPKLRIPEVQGREGGRCHRYSCAYLQKEIFKKQTCSSKGSLALISFACTHQGRITTRRSSSVGFLPFLSFSFHCVAQSICLGCVLGERV